MKIATFNINNINRRLPNLLRWLRSAKPDVVALQELKSTDEDFPVSAIAKAGYGAVWRGQKTWNGVAILARKAQPHTLVSADSAGECNSYPGDAGITTDCLRLTAKCAAGGKRENATQEWGGEEAPTLRALAII